MFCFSILHIIIKHKTQKYHNSTNDTESILSLFCLKHLPLVCFFVSCYFIPAFSCPAFSRPSFSCPAISCPAHWSANFMSCNFMPCKLVRQFHVRHFHVQHFQRPRCDIRVPFLRDNNCQSRYCLLPFS